MSRHGNILCLYGLPICESPHAFSQSVVFPPCNRPYIISALGFYFLFHLPLFENLTLMYKSQRFPTGSSCFTLCDSFLSSYIGSLSQNNTHTDDAVTCLFILVSIYKHLLKHRTLFLLKVFPGITGSVEIVAISLPEVDVQTLYA